jgi:hypothetical protein
MNDILTWNPQINTKCTNLYPGKSYCVRKHNESTLEKACVESYFGNYEAKTIIYFNDSVLTLFFSYNASVKDSDTCITVTKAHGITLDQFYDMNPSVNRGSCDNLLTGGTYCIKEESKAALNKNITHKAAKVSKISTGRTKTHQRSTKRKSRTTKAKTKKTSVQKKRKTTHTTTTTRKTTTTKKKTTTTTTTTTTSKKTTTTTHKHIKTVNKAAKKDKKEKRKLIQKNADLTYYWIAHPEEYSSSGKKVAIKDCDGKKIASVSEDYADALVMEGTGVVDNGIVNLGGCSCSNYECFMEVDKKEDPYGLTCM